MSDDKEQANAFAELANYEGTPEDGGRHSKHNYLQSAFALIVVSGFGHFLYGAGKLIFNVNSWQVVSP